MKAIQFRQILCPINFSEGSQRTVEGASSLATTYGAELRLFHVVRDRGDGRDAEDLIASLFALTRTLPERARVSAAIAYGDPSSEIIQHARLTGADLIVLGTERQSAPAMAHRTIAAEVASHAGCPVLHVRPHFLPSLSDAARGFTEIVCCDDPLSPSMDRGDYAHALAHRGHSRVTLLNVLAADDAASESRRESAEDSNGRRHVHVSLTGSPGPEIVALAERICADLIVIGAHDEASPGHTLGFAAAYVMVHAPCPVLLVPHAGALACNSSERARLSAATARTTSLTATSK
jgi:nucleotide-binding universal stress UspA family protein